ncbi:MAG TPA: GNAT family N-acetyltransferase [Thermoplasmata archaeon]|nr:GNAT family N-acetyltransferase [Thermoplasmata archaeon]
MSRPTLQFHRIDPSRELEPLRAFLEDSDPDDYLLEEISEWIHDGRLWVGKESGRWLAFGRLHDLGDGEGWVSGLRVHSGRRREGLGRQLVGQLLSDARSIGVTDLRAVIENENVASRRLFEGLGFSSATEMTLRRGLARSAPSLALRRLEAGGRLSGPVGWLPSLTGRVDLLPGADGGRFGRWRTSLVDRWVEERKLYVGPRIAAAVQEDWWKEPRTLWVNPLQGEPSSLFPALAALTRALDHEEWQAFLPSGEEWRRAYDLLGTVRHPYWGDRVQLYEGSIGAPKSPEKAG